MIPTLLEKTFITEYCMKRTSNKITNSNYNINQRLKPNCDTRKGPRSSPAMDILKWPALAERRREHVFQLVKKCI